MGDDTKSGYDILLAAQTRREALASSIKEVLPKVSGELQELMEDWSVHMFESEGTQQRAAKLQTAIENERSIFLELEDIYERKDLFVKSSQWMIGGDGWAYDIGFGGIDHVLISGVDVNIPVLDSEVYSNTDGQTSKATPASAIVKFSASREYASKKGPGVMAMTCGNAYVVQVASGANQMRAVKTFGEAEKYPDPSLVIAYTPCIIHGLPDGMKKSLKGAKEAVSSGYWPLYRCSPTTVEKNKNPMILDYRKPDFSAVPDFMKKQIHFSSLSNTNPNLAGALFEKTVHDARTRFYDYAALTGGSEKVKKQLESKESIDAPIKTRKEKATDLEAKERRAARRVTRAKRRKKIEQATKEKKEK